MSTIPSSVELFPALNRRLKRWALVSVLTIVTSVLTVAALLVALLWTTSEHARAAAGAKADFERELANVEAKFQQEVLEREKERGDWKAANGKLNDEVTGLTTAAEKSDDELAAKDGQLTRARNDLAGKDAKLQAADKKTTELTADNQKLREENGTLTTENERLALSVQELVSSNKGLAKENVELTKARDDLKESKKKSDERAYGQRVHRWTALNLLSNQNVQQELKIDKDQVRALEDVLKKIREEDRPRVAGGFGGRGGGLQSPLPPLNEASVKALRGVLSEDQDRRLYQIQIQQAGLAALQYDDVQKALSLTDEQKEKIKTISDGQKKELGALFSGGKPQPPEVITKLEALRAEALGNAMKCLIDDQRKAFKELTGEPFQVKSGGPRKSAVVPPSAGGSP